MRKWKKRVLQRKIELIEATFANFMCRLYLANFMLLLQNREKCVCSLVNAASAWLADTRLSLPHCFATNKN